MDKVAIQDQWPDVGSRCWGCGRNNEKGLHIKSYWEDDECVCVFHPEEHHLAFPNVGCGGIISTVLDCHCLNAAVSAAHRAEGRELGTAPFLLYVTKTLTVNLVKPAPIPGEWIFRAKITSLGEKRIHVDCTAYANGVEFANGTIIGARARLP